MQRLSIIGLCVVLVGLGTVLGRWSLELVPVQAEQVGSSPESGVDSRLKQAHDFLVSQGAGYGDTESESWDQDWGTMWNRIMRAATWTPEGNAEVDDVFAGSTFYTDGRTAQTGSFATSSLFADQAFQSVTAGTEGNVTWTETASGGTPVSVTLRDTTIPLSSNAVMRDERTGLYWSDRSATWVSNNAFADVSGQTDRVNPEGNHCNLNAPGDANAWCNTEDEGVSANEFCLNLALDADGDGAAETDWRLPTHKELLTAFTHGSAAHLPNAIWPHWSSTQNASNVAIRVTLSSGSIAGVLKSSNATHARCVR